MRFLLQFSKTGNMSRGRWLLFLDITTSLQDLMTGIHIPLDCEFVVAQRSGPQSREGEVSLTEVYSLHPSRGLETIAVAEWSSDEGLKWSHVSLYERRADLHGVSLKSAMIHDASTTYIDSEIRLQIASIPGCRHQHTITLILTEIAET
jgi:hypothetical protein